MMDNGRSKIFTSLLCVTAVHQKIIRIP